MSTESTNPAAEQDEPTQVLEASATEAGRSRIRPGTVAWGLIVALVGLASLGWAQGLRFDVQLASIGVLAAAGVLLVVSAVVRNRGA